MLKYHLLGATALHLAGLSVNFAISAGDYKPTSYGEQWRIQGGGSKGGANAPPFGGE